MKRKLHLLFLIVISVFLVFSCKKYEKMLDFDWEKMDIDGNVNLGIPLINADYSIGEILDGFGNMGFIKYDSNGDYYFEFAIPKSEYLNADKYSKLMPNIVEPFTLEFPQDETTHIFEKNNVNVATEDMKVNKATFESGQLRFDFTLTEAPTGSNYNIYITSNNVFNADNSPFEITLSKSNPIEIANCAGLKIIADNSQPGKSYMDFTVTTTLLTEPFNKITNFYPKISLLNAVFKDAEIEILKEYSQSFSETTKFAVFPQNVGLNITIHEPKLLLDITNTFGLNTNILLKKVCLKGKTQTESLLNHDNTIISIPKNHTGPFDITPYIKKDINLTSQFDSFNIECTAIVPIGIATVHNKSLVAAGANFSIPFDITIDEAAFSDTIAFALSGLSKLSFLDTVKMRTAFESTIPTDFTVQLLFYNSITKEVKESLFPEPLTINGSYNGIPVPSKTQYICVTNDKLRAMQQSDKIIFYLSLNTKGTHNTFNQKHYLKARVGAQIKTAINF